MQPFQAADVNGDQKLNKEEYFHLSHPEENAHIMQSVVTQEMLRLNDQDNDGKLNFTELTAENSRKNDQVNLIFILS